MKDKQKIDKIALDTAYFSPFWLAVGAVEPDRMIDVRMTYSDLNVLTELIDNEIQMKELEIKAKEISIKSDEQQLALNEMEIALKKAALASMEEDVRAKRIASYKELLSLKKETMEPFNSIEEKVNGEMESLLEIVKENDITIPA